MLVVPPKNKTFSSRVEDNLFFVGLSFPWSQSGGLSLPGLSLPGISIPGLNIPGLSLPGTGKDRSFDRPHFQNTVIYL